MLSIAGDHCNNSIACATVSHLTLSGALHGYATHKLFRNLRDDLPRVQVTFMHVAIWCIGEFGDRLLEACSGGSGDMHYVYEALPLSEILGLLETILKSHLATSLTKSYVLTALVKLSSRLQQGHLRCKDLIRYSHSDHFVLMFLSNAT